MEQLSGLDSGFLSIEAGHAVGHVSGLLICDPATSPEPWTFRRFREFLISRLHLLPVFTKKLQEVPFGLDQPYWVSDKNFDFDYHLRSAAVPGDGGREAFADYVARIHERPLDRNRPLWECYVIEGVDGDKVALLSKIHHCAIDGQAGVEMLTAVVDVTPDSPPRPESGEPEIIEPPAPHEMALRAATNMLLWPVRLARAGNALARAIPLLGPILARSPSVFGGVEDSMIDTLQRAGGAPRTSFNSVIGPHRRFAYAGVHLDAVKTVKNAAEVTVNDVVMAVVGAVLRRWLIAHEELPPRSLMAMVPISVREKGETDLGNRVSSTIAPLATHLNDPLERLWAVQEGMRVAKEQHSSLPKNLVTDLTEVAPPAVAALAAQAAADAKLAKWVTLPFNVVVSNVPGPPVPLYLNGAKVLHNIPLSAITDGVGLNVTVQSTENSLDFGFIADRDLVPDLWSLADSVGDCLIELADALDVDLQPYGLATAQKAAKKTAAKKTAAKKPTAKKRTAARKASHGGS
ncbi:MAG: wax ester/triacylglycerol synthase family O-acyltransferase [Acidimicrobiia bacterium]|nr:wax ester/triacylglycerol synthase family O-acyltransferase [Acidimicrobiia bacterium]